MFKNNRWGFFAKAFASVLVALVFFVIGIGADSTYLADPPYVVHERSVVVKETVHDTLIIPTPFPVDCEKFGFVFDAAAESYQSTEKSKSSFTVSGVPLKITCTRKHEVKPGWDLKQNGVKPSFGFTAIEEATIFDRTPPAPLIFKEPVKAKKVMSYDPKVYHVE